MQPAQFDSYAAPAMCRWLQFKDEANTTPSNWSQAVCVRIRTEPRVVTPARDCIGCVHWELRATT